MRQVRELVFMRSQENPGVLQVTAMMVLLLPFNIYGVSQAMWEDYTLLPLVMSKLHLMKSFCFYLFSHQKFSQSNSHLI